MIGTPSAFALGIFSGKFIFIFVLQKSLRAFLKHFFTVGSLWETASYTKEPLQFHSDRGFQYTSRTFHKKLLDAGMTQSMSRVGRCIDNGPMEGFWGILKRECYYGHTFTSREQLISTIESYIDYYNNRRYQHRLFIQTPMQAHVCAMNRAA